MAQDCKVLSEKRIENFKPLVMSEFDAKNHCTLASITAILNYYGTIGMSSIPKDPDKIFASVKDVAIKNSYYFPVLGTPTIFIPKIIKKVWRSFFYNGTAVNKLFFKNEEAIVNEFVEELEAERPLILSLADGRYKNHSVTVYGYRLVEIGGKRELVGIVNDNWSLSEKYINISKLGKLSSSLFIMSKLAPFR